MALQKSFTIPGTSYPITYIRIDRVDISQQAQDATLRLGIYPDKATTDSTSANPISFGIARFTGSNFDKYFSRSNLVTAAASGKTVHSIGYGAIKDALAAYKATPSTFIALIQNDFGGIEAFDGATDC